MLQYCFCFICFGFLATKHWDLSSPTRDQTHTPFTGRQSLNYWTATEVLASLTLVTSFFCHVHTCCAVLWPWKCVQSAKFPINACGPGFSHISSHCTVSLNSLAANTLPAVHCITLAWTMSLTSTAVCLWLYLTAIGVHGNQFSSVAQSNPTLQPHGLQHTRLPCPSPTCRAYSNSCPSCQWCHPTISSSVVPFSSHLQSFPSIRVFSNELVLHIRWPKYWSFNFSISPSNEHSGLISFGIDWLDLLAVQGTLKSLLQHHSSKESILWCSAFFIVQFSHPYMTTGKTIALTRWTIFGNRAPLTASRPRFSPVSCHWSAPLHSPATTLAAVHLHVPNLTPFTGFAVMKVRACGDTLQPQGYTPTARAPTTASVPTAGAGPCCWPWSSPLCVCNQPLYEHLCKDTGIMKN